MKKSNKKIGLNKIKLNSKGQNKKNNDVKDKKIIIKRMRTKLDKKIKWNKMLRDEIKIKKKLQEALK